MGYFSTIKWRAPAALAVLILVAAASGPRAQHVLTLEDALSIAMENSPDIRHTRFRLDASEARLKAREASLKTQFRLTLGDLAYQNTNRFDEFFGTWYRYESYNAAGTFTIEQPIKWTDGVLSLNDRLSWQDSYTEVTGEKDEYYHNALYLQFDQPLFTYNRTKMDLSELELQFESNKLTYKIQLLNLENIVMSDFYSLYENKMRLEINRDAMETDRESYQIMKNKYDAGIGKLDDLMQAETTMLSSESTFNSTTVSLENALDRFKYSIGLPLEDEIDIKTDIAFSPIGVDMEFAVRHGLASRMELRQQEISIISAYNSVVSAGATNEFRGDLHVSWGSSGTDSDFSKIYDKRTDDQAVSLSFDIPIWDWGRKKNNIRASEIELESEKLYLEEEKLDITMDIRESCRRLDNLVREIVLARRRVESAEKAYEINLEKYHNGDLTSQLLEGYRQQLSSAKLSEVSSLIDYKLQLLDLKIKSLWDFENDRPVLEVSGFDYEARPLVHAGASPVAPPLPEERAAADAAAAVETVPATEVKETDEDAPDSEGSYYAVHVASFQDLNRAGSETDYLERHGYSATVIATEVSGKTWYRIYVGEYQTREEASEARSRLLDLPLIDYARIVRLRESGR